MRGTIVIAVSVALSVAGPASAQLADQLSRGAAPNALDRALAQPRPDNQAQADLDRQRAEHDLEASRARIGPVPGSTMTDGVAGLQRNGSGTLSQNPAAPVPPPTPTTPQ